MRYRELSAARKTRSGAFITAWNPFSKSQSAGANAYWDRELKGYLSARGFAFLAEKVAGQLENGLLNPAFSRLACHARRPLPSVGVSDKMLSYMYRWVGRPNWLCCDGWDKEMTDDYDKSAKRYIAAEGMKPRFIKVDPEAYLSRLRSLAEGLSNPSESWIAQIPDVDIALTPNRDIGTDVLQKILRRFFISR